MNTPSETWRMADGPLYTKWAKEVSPENVWTEYPRPQLQREKWINLNGLWNYTILSKDSIPQYYSEKILVPFPVESALSGVRKRLGPEQKIWYNRTVVIPDDWTKNIILLHFEASDWETEVWIDDKKAGFHRGGYDPFSFDISEFVKKGMEHNIVVSVWDPTDEGYHPRGKQVNDPGGIFYTPSSGIWQTVWLETVSESYIEKIKIDTDIDNASVLIKTNIKNIQAGSTIEYEILKDKKKIISGISDSDQSIRIKLENQVLWSPENPFLYDIKLKLVQNGEPIDEVTSYFGMRKISIIKDKEGYNRLALNNAVLFQNGPLDQGFWPDGLNTPPSDEAMKYDIEVTKAMGFNMLRKHVKIENRRFYSWCDKLGILVWQDMPNAGTRNSESNSEEIHSAQHTAQFELELKRMIHNLYNHPSIIMWVPFNEGWGQYNTGAIVDMVKQMDSTRLVNSASGWTDMGVGDIMDIHNYPDPRCPDPEVDRVSVLGEFGGLGLYVEGHTWQKENWGYEKMKATAELLSRYENYYQEIFRMKKFMGLSAVIYTQTTDVETETNGLMTYDRDQVKMGIENIRNANLGITPPDITTLFREFIDQISIELSTPHPDASIKYSIGSDSSENKMQVYDKPFTMDNTFTLHSMCEWKDGKKSRIKSHTFYKVDARPSLNIPVKPGLDVSLYRGNWDKLPDFDKLDSISKGQVKTVGLEYASEIELFGLVFEGFLDVEDRGVYMFYLSSDDGARMYLNNNELIDYDGIHGAGTRKATAALEKGLHPFKLVYFQRTGGLGLEMSWEGPGFKKQEISGSHWKH